MSDCPFLNRHYHPGSPHPRPEPVESYPEESVVAYLMNRNREETICNLVLDISSHMFYFVYPDVEHIQNYCEKGFKNCPRWTAWWEKV